MPIGIIAISRKIEKLISENKKKVFFGGTFSGNSISSYVGMITTKYIIQNKHKIFSDLEKKSAFFQTTLNKFIKKNNIDAFVYRFKSILRLVFSSQKVLNRIDEKLNDTYEVEILINDDSSSDKTVQFTKEYKWLQKNAH